MCTIAVIIITYNAIPWAARCLLPLKNQRTSYKVYVIDNGSSDGTQQFIRDHCPEFTFVQSEVNLGFGKANNMGLELALKDGCTHFLLLNQDAHLSWESIEKLVHIQNKNVDYGILSPIHLFTTYEVDKNHLKTLTKKCFDYFNDLIVGNSIKELYNIGYTNAAIWLLSKDCLKKTGGFDPLFNHYGEDVEYAMRVNFMGFKVGVCPAVRGYHYRKQNSRVLAGKKSLNSYFLSFLIQVKQLDNRITLIYLRIFLKLTIDSIKRIFGFKNVSLTSSWLAFWKLLKSKREVDKHRKLNLVEEFCFLRYEE